MKNKRYMERVERKNLFIWIVSYFIKLIVMIPCVILSIFTLYKRNFHVEFQQWWYDNFLTKRKETDNPYHNIED
jgi:hypothetical protein